MASCLFNCSGYPHSGFSSDRRSGVLAAVLAEPLETLSEVSAFTRNVYYHHRPICDGGNILEPHFVRAGDFAAGPARNLDARLCVPHSARGGDRHHGLALVVANDEIDLARREDHSMNDKYRVWTCKVVVPADIELPDGFDNSSRRAAIEAVGKEAEVVACFSGWGGELSDEELAEVTSCLGPRSLVQGGSGFEPIY